MALPRASSPASRGASPEPLTPRSKIRALLATVESSEEEGPQAGKKKATSSLISQLPRKKHSSPQLTQGDESDESDVAIRPRGKLASRMQNGSANTRSASQSPSVPDTARERVKRMLQREEAEQQETSANDDDEDDELPTAPRRLKRRAPINDESDAAERAPRSHSPGLFVSSPMRPSPAKSLAAGEESDNDLPPLKSDRFKALVERKRQERLAREAAEEALRAERRAQQEHLASELELLVSDDGEGITDDEGGRQLSQKVRPTRKASRKAIEEMDRETQRMARSMQLAHEAKTKKKISKASLFERFNYKPIIGGGETTLPAANSSSRLTTPQSDVEMGNADTPPSSPPLDKQDDNQLVNEKSIVPIEGLEVAAQPGVVKKVGLPTASVEAGQQAKLKRRVRVRLPVVPTNAAAIGTDDDDLQITTLVKDKVDALFTNIPSKKPGESQSLQIFRALAQVKSPVKESRGKKDQSKMTPGELQAYLQLKARQQAKLERDRRLEILKGQGIVIQTAEERERQEQEVEDIVAKARQEAQKLMEEERGEARRQQRESGEVDPLAWDDSDDEEYQDVAEDAEVSAVEISGSEDEEAEADSAEEDEGAENLLFDDEADASASEAETAAQDEVDMDEMKPPAPKQQRRARNNAIVLSDDEGEVEATPKPVKVTTQMTPAGAGTISPVTPGSVLRSAKKTFIPGLPVQGPAGLGLTQIFAGTMDSQMNDFAAGPTQSMMPDFDDFPDSNFSATMDEPVEEMIVDSQQEETQGVQLNLSQSQMHGLGSLIAHGMQTQMSETLELSQDAGLQQHTPLRDRFIEPPFSTVETMIADKQDEGDMDIAQESPMVRRGRLRRRMDMSIAETAIPEASEPSASSTRGNAFQAMQDAAQKEKRLRLADAFDRKKSKAKEMIEEQAEESEDEYAGLGGVDGEDSDHESNGSVEEMIDDAAGNDNDERKLAAFYADRERANDEQQVERLFKDITTGMLRRKRGGDFDLSDSDSDGEARKRMKRRQFAKMQKALFADERVKKIAENPGNQAFLRTIEDRGSDDETDFLDALDTPSQADSESPSDTQEQAQHATTIPDSQPAQPQPLLPSTATNIRAPASMRRTKNGKKPSNMGEVRETLSNLLDEPHGSMIPATEVGSDSEEEEQEGREQSDDLSRGNKENHQPIVDRIRLKRNASWTSSTVRMAFTTQASSSFKVPALLRRATTNSTLMSGSSGSSATSSAGGFGDDAKIKKSAGKKSGIGGFARDNEQRAKVQESERRRQERRVKGARGRIGMVGGILGKGTFE